jgi:molybdopterin-guanine dinucleotide biosynthesis protein A
MAKHHKMPRPNLGQFGRIELAFLGTPCGQLNSLFAQIVEQLNPIYQIAIVEADHKAEEQTPTATTFTDKINFRRIDTRRQFNDFQIKSFFNEIDLVLVNGNHYEANHQVVVIDSAKSLEKKIHKLSDVKLVILQTGEEAIPIFLQEKLKGIKVLRIDQLVEIVDCIKVFVNTMRPKLNGLVLAGGQSTRMGLDKGSLAYHGMTQRNWLSQMLAPFCESVYWSVNAEQAKNLSNQPFIQDDFLNMGPLGGILSAFRQNPNTAWLVLACDLPFLNKQVLELLVSGRNPSKIATAFVGEGDFPEPLMAIYEPSAYPVLLQMLALGYDCPRKTLINHQVELLHSLDQQAFSNINTFEQYQKALVDLQKSNSK